MLDQRDRRRRGIVHHRVDQEAAVAGHVVLPTLTCVYATAPTNERDAALTATFERLRARPSLVEGQVARCVMIPCPRDAVWVRYRHQRPPAAVFHV